MFQHACGLSRTLGQLIAAFPAAGCLAPFAAIHTARCGFRKRTFVQVVAATGAPDPERTIDARFSRRYARRVTRSLTLLSLSKSA